MSWRDDAYCRGVDHNVFFPPSGGGLDQALAYCDCCVVTEECLEEALRTPPSLDCAGVRGGLSHSQRTEIRWGKKRRRAS